MTGGKEQSESQGYIEQRMSIMEDRLTTLNNYQFDRPHGENDLADQQLAFVREQFSLHSSDWISAGAGVGAFGSMIYHDWKKLDIDLLYIGAVSEEQISAIAYGLEPASQLPGAPAMKHLRVELYDITLDELYDEIPTLPFDKQEPDFLFGSAAMILTSVPLFPDDAKQQAIFRQAQQQVKLLARNYPHFREALITTLDDVIRVRESRRKQYNTIKD